MKREDFVRLYTMNVILTPPFDGPQVEVGEFHRCKDPQPYELQVPLGLVVG
jgi:hypothetical protein